MSLFSSVIIGAIENELSRCAPEVENHIINLVGMIAKDLLNYATNKASSSLIAEIKHAE